MPHVRAAMLGPYRPPIDWRSICLLMLLLEPGCAHTGPTRYLPASEPALKLAIQQPDAWFATPQSQRICQNIVTWQNANGGWWKRYDPSIPRPAILPPPDPEDAPPGDDELVWRAASTFDNGATYSEMRILARANRISPHAQYTRAFERGLKLIFDSQYPNGGWPQRFPLQNNYGRYITFNDGAMTDVMLLLNDIANGVPDFSFVPEVERQRCREAFDRGVECILACQVRQKGRLTVWCQQHDEKTLASAGGRAYELPSLTADESSRVAALLMLLPKPSPRVQESIHAAAAWYESSVIHGKRWEVMSGPQYVNGKDPVVIDDPKAPPLWARFYDLETNKPFFCGRDGVRRDSVTELSYERRAHYQWYGHWGISLLDKYQRWKERMAKEQEK